MKLSLSRDINGNKIVKASFKHHRGFSVQTLGNLPETHRNSDIDYNVSVGELCGFIQVHGSQRQKDLLSFEFPSLFN